MRTVGRLILIATGVAMIVFGIINLKNDIEAIKAINWQAFFQQLLKGDASSAKVFTDFLYQIFVIIVGISGLLSGIFNHAGFWFTIFSLILLVLIIIRFVNESKAGTLSNFNSVIKIILDIGLQLTYVLGFVILKIAKKKQ